MYYKLRNLLTDLFSQITKRTKALRSLKAKISLMYNEVDDSDDEEELY